MVGVDGGWEDFLALSWQRARLAAWAHYTPMPAVDPSSINGLTLVSGTLITRRSHSSGNIAYDIAYRNIPNIEETALSLKII
jgi:hypothetical protein